MYVVGRLCDLVQNAKGLLVHLFVSVSVSAREGGGSWLVAAAVVELHGDKSTCVGFDAVAWGENLIVSVRPHSSSLKSPRNPRTA